MSCKTDFSIRQVFSGAQLGQLLCDQPILTTDADSGLTLSYRFNGLCGQLTICSDDLSSPIAIGVDERDINLVATLILDGLKHQ